MARAAHRLERMGAAGVNGSEASPGAHVSVAWPPSLLRPAASYKEWGWRVFEAFERRPRRNRRLRVARERARQRERQVACHQRRCGRPERSRRRPASARQDGELLARRNAQIPLPALRRRA